MARLASITNQISELPAWKAQGKVVAVEGLRIEIEGLEGVLKIGSLCEIALDSSSTTLCEVVGLKRGIAVAQPFSVVEGISSGSPVYAGVRNMAIFPCSEWRGRIIDSFGNPLDNKGPLKQGVIPYKMRGSVLQAHSRRRLGEKLPLGVKALDAFTPCCRGQRLGIFAGSGVGKSLTLAMIARNTKAHSIVVALVGERGRELREFVEDYLGEEGMKRAVIVVSTSDEAPLMRRQAAWCAMAVAESLRDQGDDVLFLMDSVTRMAMAQREIGLSAGEPPTQKGYPPSVFAMLPQLLERAGPGAKISSGSVHQGDITALITVLVEGDDMNEPISDSVRGILDGHIILDRDIANRGRFPSVNVLESVSRSLPACNSSDENRVINDARNSMAVFNRMEELIRLGAYRKGSDPEIDKALEMEPKIEDFLRQQLTDSPIIGDDLYYELSQIMNIPFKQDEQGETE